MKNRILALILLLLFLFPVSFVSAELFNYALKFHRGVFPDWRCDFVEIPDDTSLNLGTGNFSIKIRFKCFDLYSGIILSKMNYAETWGWEFYLSSEYPNYGFWMLDGTNDAYVEIGEDPCDNKWHDLKATKNGNTLYLYKDGNEVGNTDCSGVGSISVSDTLRVGKDDWQSCDQSTFAGFIDEIKIHKIDELVGYWNFNEGTGTTTFDISGFGNDGIIYGPTYEKITGNILTLSLNSVASTTAYIGSLISSMSALLWLALGIPLGFYVIKKVMLFLPK